MPKLDIRKALRRLKGNIGIGKIDGDICAFGKNDVVLEARTGLGYLLYKLSSYCSCIYGIDSGLCFLREIR